MKRDLIKYAWLACYGASCSFFVQFTHSRDWVMLVASIALLAGNVALTRRYGVDVRYESELKEEKQ